MEEDTLKTPTNPHEMGIEETLKLKGDPKCSTLTQ